MNVLKLIHCFWKYPITRTQLKAVSYYVQYERINHSANQVFQNYGQFRYVSKHEDTYDEEIYQQLYNSINGIPNIQQLNITTNESVLFDEYEEESRALSSKMAFGYDFRDILINTNNTLVSRLATRIYFTDINNLTYQNAILPSIPFALNLNLDGAIPSLIRADFFDRQRVDQVLERENDIDLTRFQQ